MRIDNYDSDDRLTLRVFIVELIVAILAFIGIIALLSLVSSPGAKAESVSINFMYVKGENSLSKRKAFQVVQSVKNYWKKYAAVTIDIKRYRQVKNLCAVNNKLNSQYSKLDCLSAWTNKAGMRIDTFFILPPFKDSGKYWIGGYTDICGGVGYTTAELRNERNQSRYKGSVWGAIHEVGHLLGMRDTESTGNISDTDILQEWVIGLPYFLVSKQTLKEIRSCLR